MAVRFVGETKIPGSGDKRGLILWRRDGSHEYEMTHHESIAAIEIRCLREGCEHLPSVHVPMSRVEWLEYGEPDPPKVADKPVTLIQAIPAVIAALEANADAPLAPQAIPPARDVLGPIPGDCDDID